MVTPVAERLFVTDRWQTRIKNISEGIQHIFSSKEFSDVTFFVQGNPFKAHKLVLASRSLELARLLMGPNAVDEIIVPPPITVNGFQNFLSFIYNNELLAKDKKSIVEAYQCAVLYEQRALQNKCLEEIETWEIDANDSCDLLDVKVKIPGIEEKCISFIQNNANQVISSDAFTRVSDKTLTTIFESGALASVPILQLIERVMQWGKHSLSETDGDYSRVRQKLLNIKPPLLGKLGIENLEIQELPNLVVNYPNLLTAEELRQFMVYSVKKNKDHLPSWCTIKE